MEAHKLKSEQSVFSHCKICQRTLTIPLDVNLSSLISPPPDGLWNYVYVHEGPNEESHALVLLLDQNHGVRRAEVVDMCIETSGCPADFEVQAYCPVCQQNLAVPIDGEKFMTTIDTKDFYKQTFIHGEPVHTLIVLLDARKTVLRAGLSSSSIDT